MSMRVANVTTNLNRRRRQHHTYRKGNKGKFVDTLRTLQTA
jgi:hypothetical protein